MNSIFDKFHHSQSEYMNVSSKCNPFPRTTFFNLKYLDGSLYRCRVLEKVRMDGLFYRVVFIDTGAQETISATELMEATLEQNSDGFAKCFVLDDVLPNNQLELWTNDCFNVINSQLGQHCEVHNLTCYEGEGPNGIDLYTCSVPTITDLLVARGLGKGLLDHEQTLVNSSLPLGKRRSSTDTTKENVIVTFTHSPLNFWVNAVEKFELLDTVMKLLSHELFEKRLVRSVYAGMPCVAVSSCNRSESQRVRAQVLFREPHDLVVVHLIDSGERERINMSDVYEMPAQLLKIPALAKNVAICGIRLKRNCISATCEKSVRERSAIKEYFEDLTTGGGLLCLSLYFGHPSRVDLYLSTESSSVSNLLLQRGFYDYVDFGGQKPRDLIDHPLKKLKLNLERNKLYDVFMTHVDENGSFDLVQKESENKLQLIATILNKHDDTTRPLVKKDIVIGNYCTTVWTASDGGDDLYYRAQIVAKRTFGEFHVRFIDYGNTTVKHESKLRYLPVEVCRFPPQAIRARLPIPEPKFEKNNMLKVLKGFYSQCTVQGEVLGMEIYTLSCCATDPHKVNLFINSVPLLTKRKEDRRIKLESVSVDINTTVKFHVMTVDTCLDAPGFVIGAILFSYKSTLETIEKKLKKEVGQKYPIDTHELKLNDIVAVRLGGKWYRGKVLGCQRTECAIELVDYGRREMVLKEDLAPIPESMMLFPALFVRLTVREEFFDMTRARSVVENIIMGKWIEVEIQGRGEFDYLAKFTPALSEQISRKLEEEQKPYTGMDPFNNSPHKRHTPRNSISSHDSAIGRSCSTIGPSPPELSQLELYEVEFGAYCDNGEFSVILSGKRDLYAELQTKLNRFCTAQKSISNLQHLTALYAVKLPRGEWVRATIVECLTQSDAEMELTDFSGQLRRCHLDQIVELYGR